MIICTPRRTYLNPKEGLWSKAGRLLGRFGTRRKTGGTFESVRRAWRRGSNRESCTSQADPQPFCTRTAYLTPEGRARARVASYLLPDPGGEVVRDLLDIIDSLDKPHAIHVPPDN